RVVRSTVSMFVVSVVGFALVRLSGDPIQIMMPAEASKADIELVRAHLGLDRPWTVQYWRFLTQALQGDFGRSVRFRRPALDLVAERYGATLELGGLAVLIVIAVALPERRVIWRHAFKNAALPVVTFAALLFVALLNGSIIVETVFGWPGLGLLVIEAVDSRDYPIVQTVVLFLSAMYIGVNLLVDILYAYLNPKIRYSR